MLIESIKGIGEKSKELFNKLGVFDTKDLITYYPRSYDVFSNPISISEIDNDKKVSIIGRFTKKPILMSKGKFKIVSGTFCDLNNERIQVSWFNMPYIAKSINIDEVIILRGEIKRTKYGVIEKIVQPELFTIDKYKDRLNNLQPIYSLTKGLSNNLVIKAVKEAFAIEKEELDFEYLPQCIIEKEGLIGYKEALINMHFPESLDNVYDAKKRLSFDEFVFFIISLHRLKGKNERLISEFKLSDNNKTLAFINNLPFEFTNAQKKSYEEIFSDLKSGYVMNRLVQGDVGSGKTIIAFSALLDVVHEGYQGAIMAPTEVLAKQHYDNFQKLNEEYRLGLNIALVTGSVTAKEKRIAYENISNGEIDIIVGTHALIVDKIEYSKLALVITDEQHRFGVMQRHKLSEKGINPHILVMSATPIPRTLAIILYGDLDISVIDELPTNRLPIKNCVVTTDYREKAYKFIEKEVLAGHQVYVICPLVEENDEIEASDVISYTKLLKETLNDSINVEYLHGKMKGKEKNDIMNRFANNEINVLVSTTVIEVGVNVPNATVIMVENAERFGLASLHQLRGRVGRGSHQSYCIFISGSKKEETLKRLEILNKSNDGFYIASCDLKLRGPGDLFGIRQSGDMVFKIADIYGDAEMLKKASNYAKRIEEENILPEEHLNILNEKIKVYIKQVFDSINL